MTINEFKQIYQQPQQDSILFLVEPVDVLTGKYTTSDMLVSVSSSDYKVDGEVIRSGSSNDRAIADADSFSVTLDGSKHNATILEKEKYFEKIIATTGSNNYTLFYGDPYYYVKFTPINFTLLSTYLREPLRVHKEINQINPSNTFFNSEKLSVDFRTSQYNLIENNTDKSVKSKYVQKVDRSIMQVNPVNLGDILNNVAEKAEVQESNYTITGLKNSKYIGSKTNKNEYGTFPSISATEFEGAIYPSIPSGSTQLQDQYICSQSTEERDIRTLYFSINKDTTSITQGDGITDTVIPRIRTTRLFFSGSLKVGEVNYTAPNANGTNFAVPTFLNIEEGDVLTFSYFLGPGQTSAYENVLVESVQYVSESLNGPVTGTSGSVQREYLKDIDSVAIYTKNQNWSAGNVFAIHKYTPDIIYGINGSIPYRIVNKRLYLKETGEVFFVDDRGRVLAKTIDC